DDGSTNSGNVAHDPPGLTALSSDVSGDDSAHGAHTPHGHVDGSESPSTDVADNHPPQPRNLTHDPPAPTALRRAVTGDASTRGAHRPHGKVDGSDSAGPKFADDGSTNSGNVAHDPPALTALPSDVSGDESAQSGKTNQGHHASADPQINDVANNHPLQPPADNSPHTPAQHDDNGSPAVTDGAHPGQ